MSNRLGKIAYPPDIDALSTVAEGGRSSIEDRASHTIFELVDAEGAGIDLIDDLVHEVGNFARVCRALAWRVQ